MCEILHARVFANPGMLPGPDMGTRRSRLRPDDASNVWESGAAVQCESKGNAGCRDKVLRFNISKPGRRQNGSGFWRRESADEVRRTISEIDPKQDYQPGIRFHIEGGTGAL